MTGRTFVVPTIAWALVALLAAPRPAAAQEAPPPSDAEVFFEPWSFDWGTDTTLSATNSQGRETNFNNFGETPFDALVVRLYGKLAWEDRAELVVDLSSHDAKSPRVYGLWLTLRPASWIGIRAGMLPLTVGGWQERAHPDLHPLVGQPLFAQRLVSLRTDSIPADVDDLLSQRGQSRDTTYATGEAGTGSVLALAYETCWDTGVQLFGDAGPFGWKVALMQGAPGAPVTRETNGAKALEARFTWKLGDAGKLGASWGSGAYLKREVEPFLPAGTRLDDVRQELLGVDGRYAFGPVDLAVEWIRSDYDTPNVAETLRADAWSAELAWNILPEFSVAARASAIAFSDVTAGNGERLSWDADIDRVEAGAAWWFWDRHVGVKGAYQRTRVDLDPRETQEIWVAQLAVHY